MMLLEEFAMLEEENSGKGGRSSMSELVQFARIIAKAKMARMVEPPVEARSSEGMPKYVILAV
jgi:hypothetical protein